MITLLQAGILPEATIAGLKKHFVVRQLPVELPERALFLSRYADAIQGIAVRGALIDSELLDYLPHVLVISSFSAGLDNIDQDYCARRGIKIYSTSAILANDVADLALTLALMLTRQVMRGHELVASGSWPKHDVPLTQSFSSLKIGIIGLGHVGLAVAARCQCLGATVGYYGRNKKSVSYQYFNVIDDMARCADLLFVCCPLTSETEHLINQRVLEQLNNGFLVNVARGSIVDERALLCALDNHHLAGAGLDVFQYEPHVPTALRTHPRVILSPHAASGTVQTRQKMAEHVVSTLEAFFKDKHVN